MPDEALTADDGASAQDVAEADSLDDSTPGEGSQQAGGTGGWRVDGPWDAEEVDDPADGGRRVDLGGMWLAGRQGVDLQVQVDQNTGSVEGVTLVTGESGLEIRPFAAPRTMGIWEEVREELTQSLQQQGAQVQPGDGPFGPEVRALLPVQLPDGQQGVQPLRFLGVDGPRWFLRGVVSGRASVEPGAAADLEAIFRDVVVVRGKDPMAPREPLPLRLPPQATPPEAADADEQPAQELPQLPERGPEITETR
ncbi:DUF3710 domain-containing protein [Motilibacter sp. E257]|uniref:DUF3710 domain-containing protein n=1 Tax=Motilibacter deserti TaxID=2714956 RepID=A0ABX0GSJ6_9ACTN|nr:DUF3710 domain-containing protein [Motilibacter deserti]